MRTLLSLHARPTLPLAALALLAAAACSSDPGTGTGGGDTTSTTSSTTSTTGTGGSTSSSSTTSSTSGTGGDAPVCPGKGFGGTETPVQINGINATIHDPLGAPVANQPIFICGIDLCTNPQSTDSNGLASIAANDTLLKPAFKFGDALTYARLAIPLATADTTFGTLVTGKLPTAGAMMAPGSDATSGDVTLSLPAGGSVSVDELIYDTPDKALFRSVAIPAAMATQALAAAGLPAGEPGFELLYGVSPTETLLCPSAKVTVNLPAAVKASLTPNTAVEFWIMNVSVGQEYAPYAGWTKASDGAVSADGNTVSTADGAGFVYLETFAIRKKP